MCKSGLPQVFGPVAFYASERQTDKKSNGFATFSIFQERPTFKVVADTQMEAFHIDRFVHLRYDGSRLTVLRALATIDRIGMAPPQTRRQIAFLGIGCTIPIWKGQCNLSEEGG